MTAWAFPMAAMRITETREQWSGPVLRLPREVHVDEEAQDGAMEPWKGEEQVRG